MHNFWVNKPKGWTNLFKNQCRVFLNIENNLVKISEEQP